MSIELTESEAEEMRLAQTRDVHDAPLPANWNAAKAALEACLRGAMSPEKVEAAWTALAACAEDDECARWASKAQAMASYARQSDDKSLERLARRVRLRVAKHVGELFLEIAKS